MKGVIIMISGQWVKIPCKLLADEQITRADIVVFGYIADRLGQRTASIPIADIVRVCEISRRTAIDSIARLEQRGYIRADRRAGKPTVYTQLLISSAKAQKRTESAQSDKRARNDGFDPEKYKVLINNFGDSEKGAI